MLHEILTFLGLDPGKVDLSDRLQKKRNPGEPVPMPDWVAARLARWALPVAARMHERYPNEHTAQWLADARTRA